MSSAPQPAQQPWSGGLEAVNACPACGERRHIEELEQPTDRSDAAAPRTWALRRCLGCSVLYLHPRPAQQSLLPAFHEDDTSATTQARPGLRSWLPQALCNGYRNRLFNLRLRPALTAGALLVPLFPRTADRLRREDRGLGPSRGAQRRVLDVGARGGHFLEVARGLGWQSCGLEGDPAAAAAACERGAEILGRDISDLDARYEQRFDVVTLSHIIEHVHDPTQTLRHCWHVLKPGGRIWIQTPNTDSVGYEVYRAHWCGLAAPRHRVLFNAQALSACLTRAGFTGVQIVPTRNEIAAPQFRVSAARQLGRIWGRGTGPLPRSARAGVRRALQQARRAVRGDPFRSELITVVAHRPHTPAAAGRELVPAS